MRLWPPVLPSKEPGTWIHAPGFRRFRWARVSDPLTFIRENIAPLWEEDRDSLKQGEFDMFSEPVYVCDGRERLLPETNEHGDRYIQGGINYQWEPSAVVETYTRESWQAGELSVSQFAQILTPYTNPEEPDEEGFFTDDFVYTLGVAESNGNPCVLVYQVVDGAKIPMPEFRPPSPIESKIEAQFAEWNAPELIEQAREKRRNVWRFRLKLEDGTTTEWVSCSPPVYVLDPSAATYNRAATVQAEEVSGDSERLPFRVRLDTCGVAERKLSENPFPSGDKNVAVVPDPTFWELARDFTSGYPVNQRPDENLIGVDGRAVIRGDVVNCQDTGPIMPGSYHTSFRYTGLGGALIDAGFPLTFKISGGANVPLHDPNKPKLYRWALEGYEISHEVIAELGGGKVGWFARGDWGDGLQQSLNFSTDGDARPELRGLLPPPTPPVGPFDPKRSWYTIRHGRGQIINAEGVLYRPADGTRDVSKTFTDGAFCYVPYTAGSVPWRVSVVVTIRAVYIFPTLFRHCDKRVNSQDRAAICFVDSPEPSDGLGLVENRPPVETGDGRVYWQTSGANPFELGNLEEGTNGYNPDAGIYIPETVYCTTGDRPRFAANPWTAGLFRFRQNREPIAPPEPLPPSDPVYDPTPPVAGYVDEYDRTKEELEGLNPLWAYIYSTKVGVLARLFRLLFAAETGGLVNGDAANEFAAKFTRRTVQASGFFFKSLDENLFGLPGFGDGPQILSFAVYLTNDIFVPVSASVLTGANGESPLYGFPLVNGVKRAEGQVSATLTDEEKEEYTRFYLALFAMQALDFANAVFNGFRPEASLYMGGQIDPESSGAEQIVQQAFEALREETAALLNKFTYMQPVEGSAKVLGFWRV